jgi:putative hemolysin
VIRGGAEEIIGIVHAKDLLVQLLSGQPMDIQTLMRPPLFVPENMLVLELLALFKQEGSNMAIVIDEFGGLEGIVTQTDILEMIVGEMPTEEEVGKPEAFQREDGSWLLDGLLNIEELKDILDIEQLPNEKQARFQTVAGFILAQMGSIPEAGSHFEWGHYHFEVMDMDGNRIDKVLVARLPELNE